MTYKDAIASSMRSLASSPDRIFCGYNVRYGGAGGVLEGVCDRQLCELPVAENLIAGIAVGLSIKGFLPLLYFERFDFVLGALDALVNHLCKIYQLSDGQFKPSMIIRVVVGNRTKPLFTGPPHVQDFTGAMRLMLNFPVVELTDPSQIMPHYHEASERQSEHKSTMLVEYKDLYEMPF